MRLRNRSTTRLTLVLPALGMLAGAALTDPIAVAAQTITPADLIGSWMRRPHWSTWGKADSLAVQELIQTYGEDHIIRSQVRFNGEEMRWADSVWHWALHGDTLITFSNAKDTLPKSRVPPGKIRIARQGDQLVVGVDAACGVDTVRRVDLAKLPPPPTQKPPITVDPGAAAGTWARSGDHADTVVLAADKAARVVEYFDPPRAFRTKTGKWELYPGDRVVIPVPNADGKMGEMEWRFVMDRGQPVLTRYGSVCNPLEVYKRVSP